MLVATVKFSPCGPVKKEQSSGAEHRRLRPDVIIGKIDVRAFVDREQRRRHCDVDILAPSGPLAAVESRKYRDHGLQSSVDVGMRQTIGTWLRQRAAIVADAVLR